MAKRSDDAEDTSEKALVAETCANCDRRLRTLDEVSDGLCADCNESEARDAE